MYSRVTPAGSGVRRIEALSLTFGCLPRGKCKRAFGSSCCATILPTDHVPLPLSLFMVVSSFSLDSDSGSANCEYRKSSFISSCQAESHSSTSSISASGSPTSATTASSPSSLPVCRWCIFRSTSTKSFSFLFFFSGIGLQHATWILLNSDNSACALVIASPPR